MKKFYHVAWKNDQGESYNMFVVAESAAEAAQHCIDYFELDTQQAEDMDGDPEVSTLPMAVPEDMPLGPLSWNDIFLTTESVPKSSLKFQPGADEDEFCGRRRMNRCPNCGSTEHLRVEARVWCNVEQDRENPDDPDDINIQVDPDDSHGVTWEFDENTPADCRNCPWEGKWGETE